MSKYRLYMHFVKLQKNLRLYTAKTYQTKSERWRSAIAMSP